MESLDGPLGSDRAAALGEAFRRIGLDDDVDSWVASELGEDIPQLTRYRFLSGLWPKMIDSWRQRIAAEPAAQRLLAAGASRDDLAQLARAVAYDTVFALLYYLEDDGRDDCDDLPFWSLVETTGNLEPTGRRVAGLFEDLLILDPSGNEGIDLVEPLPGPWRTMEDPQHSRAGTSGPDLTSGESGT